MKTHPSHAPAAVVSPPVAACLNDIVRLAARICGTSMAAASILDASGEHWRVEAGFGFDPAPGGVPALVHESETFCSHALREQDLLVIQDATSDDRFAQHPATAGGLGLRFYAGAPLYLGEGHTAGALCVFDREPRLLSEDQLESLRALGRQVSAQFLLDRTVRELETVARQREEAERALRASQVQFEVVLDNSPIIALLKDAEGKFLYVNESSAIRFGVPRKAWLGRTDEELFGLENARPWREADRRVLAENRLIVTEEAVPTALGMQTWITHKFPMVAATGQAVLAVMSVDITERKGVEQERERLLAELREALAQVKTLRGLIPICATCKSIRDDAGYWQLIEGWVAEHSEAEFTHGLCPDCIRKSDPDFAMAWDPDVQ